MDGAEIAHNFCLKLFERNFNFQITRRKLGQNFIKRNIFTFSQLFLLEMDQRPEIEKAVSYLWDTTVLRIIRNFQYKIKLM